MGSFIIRKILPGGRIKIAYEGTLREITEEYISIDTGWSREPLDLGYVMFDPDDRWIETFFFDRWYNIFRISSKEGDLKGFYINITKPPVVGENTIDWEDLAIDLWVRPDGSYIILDVDEFEDLDIDNETREEALKVLSKLKDMIQSGKYQIIFRDN
jgi:predicted RNA-binding protein associated with RNAse of E/G family